VAVPVHEYVVVGVGVDHALGQPESEEAAAGTEFDVGGRVLEAGNRYRLIHLPIDHGVGLYRGWFIVVASN
jgi:hypothetical protein